MNSKVALGRSKPKRGRHVNTALAAGWDTSQRVHTLYAQSNLKSKKEEKTEENTWVSVSTAARKDINFGFGFR